ncbi:MAG: leucyl/phenylalanyl-tRNA--protein transferase [Bacteroidales bacterium]|nr:leucyl/phenylalanyl-tRNA--protein transferase [Bacteroidales bacterium]
MYIYQLNESIVFPPAHAALAEGLLAIGGDLRPERLIKAYSEGIFPWYEEDQPILWWSPDPRLVLKPEDVYVSKSLKKTIREKRFEISFDTNFEAVIDACANTLRGEAEGTWITPELRDAFIYLHKTGLAHSVEAYKEGKLAGGLYGLSLGTAFFGESMFYNEKDASKVAFFYLVDFLKSNGFELIDAQQDTPHLRSFGAKTIARSSFLEILKTITAKPSLVGNWGNGNNSRIKIDNQL